MVRYRLPDFFLIFQETRLPSDGAYYSASAHEYLLVTTAADFNTAVRDSATRTFQNWQGYLATITEQGELNFVYNELMLKSGVRDAWIAASDLTSQGTFRWVHGPEVGQIVSGLWSTGEPNGGTSEDCTIVNSAGQLNDVSCARSFAYIVEYEPPKHNSKFEFLLFFGA